MFNGLLQDYSRSIFQTYLFAYHRCNDWLREDDAGRLPAAAWMEIAQEVLPSRRLPPSLSDSVSLDIDEFLFALVQECKQAKTEKEQEVQQALNRLTSREGQRYGLEFLSQLLIAV